MSQNATELINAALPNSLLHFFSTKNLRSLLEQSKVIFFSQITFAQKTQSENSLAMLLQGDVSTPSKKIKAGFIFGLKDIFGTDDASNFTAHTKGMLLVFSKDLFLKYLKENQQLHTYLQRIFSDPSFQKIKRDLPLLGASSLDLQSLISQAEILTSDQLQPLLSNNKKSDVFLIQKGSVKLFLKSESQKRFIEEFSQSDYFFNSSTHTLEAICSSNFSAWRIDLSNWIQKKSEPFLFQNPLDKKIETLMNINPSDSPNEFFSESGTYDLNEEDDGLQVKDFQPGEHILKKHTKKKFPIFLQHDAMDCGAACLAMISSFYNKKINIPTWRNLVHITREGASMLALKRAANHVGFDSIGVMSGYKALQKLHVPLIALMQYHFVVVYKITDTHVTFGDPAVGLRTLAKEDFLREYSNNCLLLKPNRNLSLFPQSKNTFLKYLKLFRDSKLKIFEIGFISTLIFIFGLALPLFSQFIFDNVLKTQDKQFLTLVSLIFVGIGIFTAFTEKIRSNLIQSLTSKLDTQFTALFLNHVFRLPFSYFSVRDVGDISTRLDELKNIRKFFCTKIVITAINLLSIIIYSTVLYLYNPKLFLCFIPVLPPFVFFLIHMLKKVKKNLNETFYASRKNQSLVYEQVKNVEALQSLHALLPARWRYEETLEKVLALKLKFEKTVMQMNTSSIFIQDVMQYLLYAFAGFLFMKNELTLGQVVAVSQLSASLISPLIALIQDWDEFNKISISLEKVDEIFTSPTENLSLNFSSAPSDQIYGDISFKDIYFQYGSEHSPMVLKNVSLDIPQGSTVALVGQSGCGKTTLAYMLNQLYTPIRGKIFVGGKDVSLLPLEHLRTDIALINQDNNIFAGTIEENILLGSTQKNHTRLIQAAQWADAHDFIMEKEGGYAFVLGENGDGLSDGQKQRINIARALYRDPKILIMDEATSMLDAQSEAKIIENIKQQSKNRTTLIIAHRLNTIMHADQIYVMHNGKIREHGSHNKLLSEQKLYYQMFKRQLTEV